MTDTDIAVIGAGPAGMAAACTAANQGASVVVLDEQPSPGGQIYRQLEDNKKNASPAHLSVLGKDYLAGQALIEEFRATQAIDYRPGTTVWRVDEDATLYYSQSSSKTAASLKARHIIIANGATERPVPLPGWTLPGVMTIGAAQILLKNAAVVPQSPVLIGSGPLLYLFATQLLEAGITPKAILETQNTNNYREASRHLPAALKGYRLMLKGLRLINRIRRSGVPRYTAAQVIQLQGEESLQSVTFNSRGKLHQLQCSTALLHLGIVPNTQITRALGLSHHWNEEQHCFHPTTDNWGKTPIDVVSVAGDGAAIAGATAAHYTGCRVALNALCSIGKIDKHQRDTEAAVFDKRYQQELTPRPLLDTLYRPLQETLLPADTTVVCRCEEVTAGDIRHYAKLGCTGPNQTKAFGRCGMGPCQGRYCALTVTSILAEANKLHPDQVGSYRIRAPIKPVTLAELASLSIATATATDIPD